MKPGLRVAGGLVVVAGAVVFAVGCGKSHEAKAAVEVAPVPAMKPAPATPINTTRVETGGWKWNSEWDKFVELALPPEMLSRQVPRDVEAVLSRGFMR